MVHQAAINTRDQWAAIAIAVYAAMIEDRVHFAQAAYRDGEWYCIGGSRGKTINAEEFNPELGKLLAQTLLDPVGQWCVLWWKHPKMGRQASNIAAKWIATHKPKVRWIPDRPVSRANEIGMAAPFFRACRSRRVIAVGPEHFSNLSLFDIDELIVVPPRVAWKHTDRVREQVLSVYEPDDLILFAAGMGSNLMIWELWPHLRGEATLLDVGAALDPYCGHFSRGVFREPGWQENIMPRNIP